MEDRLESETRISSEPGAREFAVTQAPGELMAIAEAESVSPEIQQLISRCMEGTEIPDRPLKPWEPAKFSTQNIQVVLMRAAGFRQNDIARILTIDQARVSVICTHPYGKKILQAMMYKQSDKVLDIRTRLEAYAGETLERMRQLTMVEEDLKTVAAVGFGLLDRAGYSTVQKSVSKNLNVNAVASEHTMSRLADVLGESARVNAEIMPTWVPPKPPDDGSTPVETAASITESPALRRA